jgi:hypothetical protein
MENRHRRGAPWTSRLQQHLQLQLQHLLSQINIFLHIGTQAIVVLWAMTISGIGVGEQHSLAKTLCPLPVAPAVSPNLITKREAANVALL